MNGTLEQMFEQLAAHGWECKLRSRQGAGFIASVWKPDVLGGGSNISATTFTEALTLALQDAIRRRRNRKARLKRQQRGVGLEGGEGVTIKPLQPEQMLDEAMVDALATAMKAKLAHARKKGRGGWERSDVCSVTELWDMLLEHAHKGNLDMVDVANFAGMIWWRMIQIPGDTDILRAHVRDEQTKHPQTEIVEYCGSFNPDRHGERITVLYRGPRANGSRWVFYLCADEKTVGECPESFFERTTRPLSDAIPNKVQP